MYLRTNDDFFVQNTNNTQLSDDNDRQMTIMDYMDISHVDLGALGIDDIDKLDSFLHSLRTLARDVEDKKNDLEYEKAEKIRNTGNTEVVSQKQSMGYWFKSR